MSGMVKVVARDFPRGCGRSLRLAGFLWAMATWTPMPAQAQSYDSPCGVQPCATGESGGTIGGAIGGAVDSSLGANPGSSETEGAQQPGYGASQAPSDGLPAFNDGLTGLAPEPAKPGYENDFQTVP